MKIYNLYKMTDRLTSSYRKCIYYLNTGLGRLGFLKHANTLQLLEYFEQKRKENSKQANNKLTNEILIIEKMVADYNKLNSEIDLEDIITKYNRLINDKPKLLKPIEIITESSIEIAINNINDKLIENYNKKDILLLTDEQAKTKNQLIVLRRNLVKFLALKIITKIIRNMIISLE